MNNDKSYIIDYINNNWKNDLIFVKDISDDLSLFYSPNLNFSFVFSLKHKSVAASFQKGESNIWIPGDNPKSAALNYVESVDIENLLNYSEL